MNRLTAGLGLKPEYFDAAERCAAPGLWFEVHPENYLLEGGPRLAWLDRVRAAHPLSLHSVAMSLASAAAPDEVFLDRLATLVERTEPALVSGHLAWNNWRGRSLPDLLPVPRTAEAGNWIVANLGRVQDRLKRSIAIENPSHYLAFEDHEQDEAAFMVDLARRSGCTLLLDVNNVFVSARNLGLDAEACIDALPGELISEIHLAGHTEDPALGAALLVDSHDAPVAPAVWSLYERLIARIGVRPTLVERDDNLPPFEVLIIEREQAHRVMQPRWRDAA